MLRLSCGSQAYSYNFDAITEKHEGDMEIVHTLSANVRNHIDNGAVYMGKYGRHNTAGNIIYDPIFTGVINGADQPDFAEIQKGFQGKLL